jgi:hypothetical protein
MRTIVDTVLHALPPVFGTIVLFLVLAVVGGYGAVAAGTVYKVQSLTHSFTNNQESRKQATAARRNLRKARGARRTQRRSDKR